VTQANAESEETSGAGFASDLEWLCQNGRAHLERGPITEADEIAHTRTAALRFDIGLLAACTAGSPVSS
jgi:hypothetical protein